MDRADGRSLRIALVGFGVGRLGVGIAQALKFWAETSLSVGERIPILGDAFGIQLAYNPGAAFSFGEAFTPVITVIAVAAVVVVSWLIARTISRGWAVGLGLILGGALGNLIDRLARPPGFGVGYVVDYLAYGDWFIGNLADAFIVVGFAVCVVLSLLGRRMRPIPVRATPSPSET